MFDKNKIRNFVNGSFIDASASDVHALYSPVDGSIIAKGHYSSSKDIDDAVTVASDAQKRWALLTHKKRAEVMYNYLFLLKKHREELAEICHIENGKTMGEALAGADKAIELCEFAASMPQIVSGEVQQVSKGVVCATHRVPIGVVASITPFNFPIMVPHWTVPNALVLGNAVILKPSELTPLSALKSAELWKEAGLPDGLLNVMVGAKETVEAICDHPKIDGVTFVGSTPIAKIVYQRSSQSLKRVISCGGAKNYILLSEHAHPQSVQDIVAAFSGMCGQRCMAASVLVTIGTLDTQLSAIVSAAEKLIPGRDTGAMISKQSIEKVSAYLDEAQSLGAKILLDGRKIKSEGHEHGYYIGPSIIDWRGNEDKMPLEEIFGPTLEILEADSLESACAIQRKTPYGNAVSIFTQNGREAVETVQQCSAGMVGVNIGIPVPREPFSFGGINDSRFGQGGITGKPIVDFLSDIIKVTTKWNPEDKKDWMS